jgi:hypothetical protein
MAKVSTDWPMNEKIRRKGMMVNASKELRSSLAILLAFK